MANEETRSIAVTEFQDEDGVTALLIHQLNPETYYAVFDTGKVTRGFDTLEKLKEFLMSLNFQEI